MIANACLVAAETSELPDKAGTVAYINEKLRHFAFDSYRGGYQPYSVDYDSVTLAGNTLILQITETSESKEDRYSDAGNWAGVRRYRYITTRKIHLDLAKLYPNCEANQLDEKPDRYSTIGFVLRGAEGAITEYVTEETKVTPDKQFDKPPVQKPKQTTEWLSLYWEWGKNGSNYRAATVQESAKRLAKAFNHLIRLGGGVPAPPQKKDPFAD